MRRTMQALLAVLASSCILPTAAAQTPSRLSLEKIKQAVCEKADMENEVFRPRICDPLCTCIEDLTGATYCQGSVPGTVEVGIDIPGRDAVCARACVDNELNPVGKTSSPVGCVDASVPLGAYWCDDPVFWASNPCGSDDDCAPGFSCGLLGDCIYDGAFSCSMEDEICAAVPATQVPALSLVGVGAPDSGATVSCERPALQPVLVNNNDALACRDLIEQTTSLDCPDDP